MLHIQWWVKHPCVTEIKGIKRTAETLIRKPLPWDSSLQYAAIGLPFGMRLSCVWRSSFLGGQFPSHTLLRISQRVKIPHIKAHQGFPDSSVGKEPACNAGDPSLIPGSRRSAGEEIGYPLQYSWVSPVAQLVKNPPEMQETWGWSLGWEDSLWEGKGYPLQYSCLENSMDWQATDHGVTELDMTE